jgi:hypothetical protein
MLLSVELITAIVLNAVTNCDVPNGERVCHVFPGNANDAGSVSR